MQCISCKGKGLCGLPRCPITSRFLAQTDVKISASYQGSAPSVFVGSFGYPDIRRGPLLIDDSDHPPDWLTRGLGIEDIVSLRARTICGRSPARHVEGGLQEIARSSLPLEVDVAFSRPVSFAMTFDGTVAPMGFSGEIRRLDVVGSAKVERIVDRITGDTDLGAGEACMALSRGGSDVYGITKLMTAGLPGKRRCFVPTRWAITAVDDTISTALKKEIARYPPLDEYLVFSGEVFSNRIVCILAPGDWRYEMIEIWGKQTLWAGDAEVIVQDREGMTKQGYSPISGAYYSARLAACEYLARVRHSARVIVLRHISSDYWAPLGTWVIREATRKAMASPPVSCESLEAAVATASARIGFSHWQQHSTLIPEMRTQRSLFSF
ncbi:Protein of unknown function DUF650, N-terminal domain [Methanoregula boonei 6A8]|uniref:DNA repair protein n=1 Tax=Methanoregula boonei (strain DSM 21154 / JCM 14090 / 6A8) TaxID=456442 RepID=A7IAB0_METB6|nr:Protein of unknown function DUF650, N-terminal domain [Methanoregula boonei 6A8]